MSGTIGEVNLELTDRVTWPIASGYTNCINPTAPSDNIMDELGVHFYRLGGGNFNEDHQINTEVIDRLAGFNVCVILDLTDAWSLWRERNGETWKYFVWEHLCDFEEAIEQSVNRIQPHITNKKKFWVNVWNEPDWWCIKDDHKGWPCPLNAHNVDWNNPAQVKKLKHKFWKGNYQDFQNTWATAYNKLRTVLKSEQKILGPGFSGFNKTRMHTILDWMNNENPKLLPDHISFHYPGGNLDGHVQDLRSWGYGQSVYIGEYLGPVPDGSYGRPGTFAYQIAAFNDSRITGGAINPTGSWGAKGMDGLLAVRKTNKLTNLGYVCKLYTEATSVNNRPVASVLDVTDAGNTKIFATKRYDKTHILMGAYYKEEPVITKLELNNAENYYYQTTLWIIPFSTKNDPCDESDLIKYNMGSRRPENGTLAIDVTAWSDWSERENGSKNDACYIEVEKVIPPFYVSIDGPSIVSNPYGSCTAEPFGGIPPYEYSWKIRRHTKDGSWGPFSSISGGKSIPFRFGNNIDEVQLVVEVIDNNNETASGTLYVRYDPSR